MAYAILGTAKPAFFDSSGAPLASGTLTVQDPDDSSAKDTYPTANDADASTNGVSTAYTLDSRGEIATQLWGRDGEDYKVILKDSSGSTVYTIDEIRLPQQDLKAITTAGAGDATPTVDGVNILRLVNGVTYTDFDDGQVGQQLTIFGPSSGTSYLTDSGSLNFDKGLDIAMGGTDTLSLQQIISGGWYEMSRSVNESPQYMGPVYQKTVTSDVSLTSSTLAAVAAFSDYFLLGGTFYKVTGYLEVSADAAARDLEIDFVTDTAFTDSQYTWISVDSGNALTVDQGETQALTAAVADIDIDGTGSVGIIINGHVETGGTTASISDVDVHMANKAGAGTVTLHTGSWIRFEAISN
jgi:hypothetical protein